MKTLYLDCAMGAAGDMLTAALLELMPDREAALAELNAIGVPGVVYGCETVTRCGVQGTHMSVKINGAEESEAMHEHSHDHHDRNQHDEYETGAAVDLEGVVELGLAEAVVYIGHHNAQQPLRGHAESDRVAQAGTLHPHTHQGGNKNSQ